jgi:hypothetical protein
MGLTIHYEIESDAINFRQARKQVEAMRQLALDLPFDEVQDIKVFQGDQCDPAHAADEDDKYLLSCLRESIEVKQYDEHIDVRPTDIVMFSIIPGPGCEWADIALVRYPATVEYRGRRIRTNLGKNWRHSSFCKTQYANSPDCGGTPNFIRCHIGLVTLLEKMQNISGVKVNIEDEGKYGPSTYSDDYKEAYAAGLKPTYVWHPGKYNVKALVEEIGEWDTMIAAFAGALKDATGKTKIESPIFQRSDFEALEFKGSQNPDIQPFLKKMAQAAKVDV